MARWLGSHLVRDGDAGWPDQPRGQHDRFLTLWRPHVGGWSGCWNTLVAMADSKLSALYYSSPTPRLLEEAHSHQEAGVCSKGDWAAGHGLAQKAGHLADLSACPTAVPGPKLDVAVPNEVHQADLLFLPHDLVGRKTYRYALSRWCGLELQRDWASD